MYKGLPGWERLARESRRAWFRETVALRHGEVLWDKESLGLEDVS